jgi:hypothetical protein
MPSRTRRRVVPAIVVFAAFVLAAVAVAPAADAQPFGSWSIFEEAPPGYIQVPHHPALNPTGQITIEGWVDLDGPSTPGLED